MKTCFRSILSKEGVWTRGANDGRGTMNKQDSTFKVQWSKTACSRTGQKNTREYWYSMARIEY